MALKCAKRPIPAGWSPQLEPVSFLSSFHPTHRDFFSLETSPLHALGPGHCGGGTLENEVDGWFEKT